MATPTMVITTQQTMDRSLVHRAALAEVFLTDFRSVSDSTFHASAQLPPCHFYYSDHSARPAIHDPLAVFESVRQMLLCAMHLQHGAAESTKSITAEAELEISDPEPLRAGGRALDLALLGTVALEKTYQGATSRVIHEVKIHTADGRQVGSVRVDTALRPDDAYQVLRMAHRTDPPPRSDSLPATVPDELVAPHLAGRERARNVVLHATRSALDEIHALLHVPTDHPSMFDHPHDHVPGPVMMEAARQAALFLARDSLGKVPARLWLRSMRAEYHRFAELDDDIVVRAGLRRGAPGSGQVHTEVALLQLGETVATMDVRLGVR